MAKVQVLSVAPPPSLNPTQTSENKELGKKKSLLNHNYLIVLNKGLKFKNSLSLDARQYSSINVKKQIILQSAKF